MTTYRTRSETAELLRCSPWTVSQLIGAGKLRAAKVGGRLLIDEQDIAAYVDSQATVRRRRRRAS